MWFLLLMVVFVALATLGYVALRNAQDFSDANEVVPGVPTRAPKEWAGAHSPEAKLHRRLRDSISALRTNAELDDPSMAGVRAGLEREALAVDDALVAAAALPKQHRGPRLQQVADAVEAIEETVASVMALRGPALADVQRGIDDVRTRLRLVEEARAELAALDPAPGALDELRRRLEDEPDAEPDPGPGEPAPG